MSIAKSKSLENIEEKMQQFDENSFRYHVLESAKNFKTSWIELGRALYEVFKDKLYKEWDYNNFDIYTNKEIGIKKPTALKLLRSYYFLEKEEPTYLKGDHAKGQNIAQAPSLDSVDVLRLAKNKKLDENDYAQLKKEVFEKGTDAREIKKDLTALIRQRTELDPEAARQKRKQVTVKRFLTTLKSLKQELELAKLLPASLIKEAESLIKKLEDYAN